jgi:hypothetical protein
MKSWLRICPTLLDGFRSKTVLELGRFSLGRPPAGSITRSRHLPHFEAEAKQRQIRKPGALSAPIGADKISRRAADDVAAAFPDGVNAAYR